MDKLTLSESFLLSVLIVSPLLWLAWYYLGGAYIKGTYSNNKIRKESEERMKKFYTEVYGTEIGMKKWEEWKLELKNK